VYATTPGSTLGLMSLAVPLAETEYELDMAKASESLQFYN